MRGACYQTRQRAVVEGKGWGAGSGQEGGWVSGGGDGGGEHRWTPQLVQAKLLLPAGVRQ